MIDPLNITNFSRTEAELEEFLLFAILVAGKKSIQQSAKLEAFLSSAHHGRTPLDKVRFMIDMGVLHAFMEKHRLGQYNRVGAAFSYLAHHRLDLATCSVYDLEAIPGVGFKTARFFLLHSRPNARVAAIDTHILKFIREHGHEDVPAATPTKAQDYHKWEAVFLGIADRLGLDPAHLDLREWSARAATS